MDSISPPNRPHYPWKQGEILIADELNAAIANAGHGTRVTDWIPGGQPDGVTDLAPYFQAALDAAADVDLVNSNRSAAPGLTRLIVPANPIPYMLGSALHVPSNSYIVIEMGATLKGLPNTYAGGFLFNPDVPGTIIENVIIELYGTLDGDWLNQPGDIAGGGPIGAGVQGGIAGGPCNNVYIYGNRQGTITRFKNWPINLARCSNSEVRGLNVSYCGNTVHFAGTTTQSLVIPDPASYYDKHAGVVSFRVDPAGPPHGINVGDTFYFFQAVIPSNYIQGEYVAATVPNDHTVTAHVAIPTVGDGPILGGKIGYTTHCYNVHIVDCLIEHITDLAVVLYSGCHHSSIRDCEVRYCVSSGPTIFADPNQPAACSDCEISGCYVHDNQGGGTGSTSNQPGVVHKNVRVFNNVIHDNLAGGLVVNSANGIEVFGNVVHNCTQVSGAATGTGQTSSVVIGPTATKANIWGNTVRDPGKSLLSSTITLGAFTSYNPTTGVVTLQTLKPPLTGGVPKNHNINVGDQFNLALAIGTGDCLQLNGWQTATTGTSGSTLNFTVATGLVFTLRQISVRQFTYAPAVSHIIPGAYTSDTNGNISVQTDGVHGYPVGAWFVLDQVVGSSPGTGGATDYAGAVLNGQQLATTGTSGTTLNFFATPNSTVVVTKGGRVLPAHYGILISGVDEADANATSPGTGPDYLRLSGNRMGDYQAPRNMVCAIGGVWGLNGVADGNYFGPRLGFDPDVSDYNQSGVSGFNYDLVYNNAPTNMQVTGLVTFGPVGGISTKYLPPQGLTPSWNYRVGRGEVDFFCGPGQGGPGGFEFFQVQVIRVAATGNTYDPVTGIVTLITAIPHTVLPGGTFSLNSPIGTDLTDTGTDDVIRIRGSHIANSDTTSTTLTFNAALNMTIQTITGGIVVPAHTGGGLVNTSVGLAGSLLANDGLGNTRLGGALVHGAIQVATLANAGTVIVPQNTSFMLVQNASSIATGTIVMPSPMAGSYQTIGSELTLRFQSAVGSLSFTGAPVAGPPTTVLSAGASFRFIQGGPGAAANTWLPCLPDVSGTPPVGGPYLPTSGGAVTGPLTVNGLLTATAGITGSGINSTPIGATTPSTGAFTNLSATGTVTLPAGTTGPFLPLIGGNMTGTLTSTAAGNAAVISGSGSGISAVVFNSAEGLEQDIKFNAGAVANWTLTRDTGTKAALGNNFGGKFGLAAYTDASTFVGYLWQGTRGSGPVGQGGPYFNLFSPYVISKARATIPGGVVGNDVSFPAAGADVQPVTTLGNNPLSTTSGSAVVNITWTNCGAAGGVFAAGGAECWVNLLGVTATGGITPTGWLKGTRVDNNTFSVTWTSNATSTATGGGAAVTVQPSFVSVGEKNYAVMATGANGFPVQFEHLFVAAPSWYQPAVAGTGPKFQQEFRMVYGPPDAAGVGVNTWGIAGTELDLINRGPDTGYQPNLLTAPNTTIGYWVGAWNPGTMPGYATGGGTATNWNTVFGVFGYNGIANYIGYSVQPGGLVGAALDPVGGHGGVAFVAFGSYSPVKTYATTVGTSLVTITTSGAGPAYEQQVNGNSVYIPTTHTFAGVTWGGGTYTIANISANTFQITGTGTAASTSTLAVSEWLAYANRVPYAPMEFQGSYKHGINTVNFRSEDGSIIRTQPGNGIIWDDGTGTASITGAVITPGTLAVTTTGRLRFTGLPTSSAGLAAGTVWNNAGTLCIA